MPYDVFLYNVPKVTEDGEKVIPVPPCETKEFSDEEEAKKFAAERKGDFDRVVVIHREGEGEEQKQKKIDRFMDGQREEQAEEVSA